MYNSNKEAESGPSAVPVLFDEDILSTLNIPGQGSICHCLTGKPVTVKNLGEIGEVVPNQ